MNDEIPNPWSGTLEEIIIMNVLSNDFSCTLSQTHYTRHLHVQVLDSEAIAKSVATNSLVLLLLRKAVLKYYDFHSLWYQNNSPAISRQSRVSPWPRAYDASTAGAPRKQLRLRMQPVPDDPMHFCYGPLIWGLRPMKRRALS